MIVTWYDNDVWFVADPLISVQFTDQHDPVLSHGHVVGTGDGCQLVVTRVIDDDLGHVDKELLLTDLTDHQDGNEEDC